jgi:hypothetical protein
VGLAQLVRFIVVELTHLGSILRFDTILYLWLIILLVRGDILIDNETLLVTDFVNLKIKPIQFFRSAYRGRICTHVFID